jgi:hypothetical protein
VDSEFRKKFRTAFDSAMEKISKEFGCTVILGPITSMEKFMISEVQVFVDQYTPEGKIKRPEQVRWEYYCSNPKIGLPADIWGKAFNHEGKLYAIWDINIGAKKKHVLLKNKDGTITPASPDMIKKHSGLIKKNV